MNVPAHFRARLVKLGVTLSVVLYAIALLTLINVKPLWLDEVIQLEGTAGTGWRSLVQHVIRNAGGAPLGYLGQQWLISIAGLSIWTTRLLSVLAGVGSMALFLILAKSCGLRRSTAALAASLWVVCPLVFRYSLEGRPYMQALLFALAAVVAQVKLSETFSAAWAVALAGCLAAAVYSQPFAVFGPLGFSLCKVWQSPKSKSVALTCWAYAIAALSFIPWLLITYAHWRNAIEQSQSGFRWSSPLVLVLFRECVGDGYPAAIPAVLLAVCGIRGIARRPFRDPRLPLIAAVIASVVLALLADATFNYFFAIRQVIYMTPFLLLIVAEGAAAMWQERGRRIPSAILIMGFIGASVTKDYGYLTDRKEDWSRLSARLSETSQAGCILLPADADARIYAVFRPDIAHRLCGAAFSTRQVIVPLHPYTDPRAKQVTEARLWAMGMARTSIEQVGFAQIEVFTNPAPSEPRP